MPTIHLSVPDRVYEKLRQAAEAYNIQVTDLIKIFIKANLEDALEGRLVRPQGYDDKDKLYKRMDELEAQFKERIEILEQTIKALSEMLLETSERVGKLELDVEELKEIAQISNAILDAEIVGQKR